MASKTDERAKSEAADRKGVDGLEVVAELGSDGFLLVNAGDDAYRMLLLDLPDSRGRSRRRISIGLVATAIIDRTMDRRRRGRCQSPARFATSNLEKKDTDFISDLGISFTGDPWLRDVDGFSVWIAAAINQTIQLDIAVRLGGPDRPIRPSPELCLTTAMAAVLDGNDGAPDPVLRQCTEFGVLAIDVFQLFQ
ncbi:hypothetical protein ACLOJK_037060 [Asimina triloba]